MSVKTVYLKICGRVPGVGFRWWTKRTAKALGGVSGWVRNTEDGGVEVFMRGEEENIERMIAACRRGPLTARVDGITFLPPVIRGFLPDITDGKFDIV